MTNLLNVGFLSLTSVGETDGDRGSHKITSPPTDFYNWSDAETHMLELAKAWIDGRA
jgi:hypothetical protein